MVKFKVGDKVIPISVDYVEYQDDMKSLLGKTLTVIEVYPGTGCPTICAGSPGTISRFWFANDLHRVFDEEPTSKLQTVNSSGGDSTKVTAAKSRKKFKVGDYVVLIAGPGKGDEVHVVTKSDNPAYPLRVHHYTHTEDGRFLLSSGRVCMRHATADEIAAQQKPNLPRRGDLVKCRDLLWIVYSEGEDSDGEYRLASLTGDPRVSFVTLNELSWAGSVRKKIKRVKKEMEGES